MPTVKGRFEAINTKIVGVTMGPEGSTRQLALEKIRQHWSERERWFVDLVPEPDNPFDSCAVRCLVDVPGMGRTQVGYIRNSGMCNFCKYEPERFPSGETEPTCPQCNNRGTLKRNGLATHLTECMEADPHLHLYGEIQQITGGPGPDDEVFDEANNGVPLKVPGTGKKKSYGCNIQVKGYIRKEER
jgi:hypothetical protein